MYGEEGGSDKMEGRAFMRSLSDDVLGALESIQKVYNFIAICAAQNLRSESERICRGIVSIGKFVRKRDMRSTVSLNGDEKFYGCSRSGDSTALIP